MTHHLTLDRHDLFEILINYKRTKLMNSKLNTSHQNQTRLEVSLAAGVESVIADGLGVC